MRSPLKMRAAPSMRRQNFNSIVQQTCCVIRLERLLQKGCQTRFIDVCSPVDAFVTPRTMPKSSDFPYHATGLIELTDTRLRLHSYLRAAKFWALEITYNAASSGVNPNELSRSKILRDQSHVECSATCLRRLTLRLELLSSLSAFQCPSRLTNSSSSSVMNPPTLCSGAVVSMRTKSVETDQLSGLATSSM